MGADLSFLLAIFFTGFFLYAWRLAKNHKGNTHHTLTLWGMLLMLVYFSGYYLIRDLGVLALEGREGFGGGDFLYSYAFIPILTVHVFLASVGIFIAFYMINLGFRASFLVQGKRVLKEEELRIKQKDFYVSLASFLVFFGIVALIRCATLRCMMVYVIGFLLVSLVFIFEKFMERVIPIGAKRHRVLGKITMLMFVSILITSMMTYSLLYIFYAPTLSGH